MSKKINYGLPPNSELRQGLYIITEVIGSGGMGITYKGTKKTDMEYGESLNVVIKELFIAPNLST